jgi:hypothetical protein
MAFDRNYTFSGLCCADCLFLLANGDEPADWTPDEVAEWRARIAQHTAGTEVTLGAFREDHACRTNFTVTYAPTRYSRRRLTVEVLADDIEDAREQARWTLGAALANGARLVGYPCRHDLETESDRGGDCECVQQTFSHSPCDVCGSGLAGAREAVVFWLQPETASA